MSLLPEGKAEEKERKGRTGAEQKRAFRETC